VKTIFRCVALVLWLGSCTSSTRKNYDIPNSKKGNVENQHLASISILSDAIKNNPSNPDNYYKRAVVHLEIENYKDALVDISRAEKLDPNSGLYLYTKAKAQNYLKMKGALSTALAAEVQNFDNPTLFTLIADLYTQSGNYNKAQEYIHKAESIYPYNSDVFLQKGKFYAKRGDTLTAINNYRRAILLKGHSFEAYDQLIKIYNRYRLIDSALVVNEVAMKKFPAKSEIVYNKAEILESAGLGDSAITVYKRFFAIEPNRNDVLGKIGNIYFRRKNYAGASLVYQKWSKLDPENIVPIRKTAQCFEQQKDYFRAKVFITKALELEPKNQQLLAELARYKYIIDLAASQYTNDYNRNYTSTYRKEEAKEEPEPVRRIFGGDFGKIEKIQHRSTVKIGKDSTRN
jgi:tetratricopeptide (TPR) repeat protein